MLYNITLAALCAVIFVNGWTDAPNAVASAVGSRSMRPGSAVALAAVCNLAGALTAALIGGGVARSVYSIADFGGGTDSLLALLSGLAAVFFFAVFAWYFGIPTSESHALLAGLAGAAAGLRGAASVNTAGWGRVALGLLVSTLPVFLFGRAAFAALSRVFRKADRRRSLSFFIFSQRAGAAAGAYLHGLQDGQKFMGIFMLSASFAAGGQGGDWGRERAIPFAAALVTALVMALGTAAGGTRIIKKVALHMVKLDAPRGVAADISASLCLAVCTSAGLPVSTTHAKTCAVMGAGSAGRRGGLNYRDARDMFLAWFLTFPVCFFLGWFAARLARGWR